MRLEIVGQGAKDRGKETAGRRKRGQRMVREDWRREKRGWRTGILSTV